MAARSSVLCFVNPRFAPILFRRSLNFSSSKGVFPLSRRSYQYLGPTKQLHTFNKCLHMDGSSLPFVCQNLAPTLACRNLSSFPTSSRLLQSFKASFTGNMCFKRGVTLISKKGKRKTCKAVAKRFIRTGNGKLKRWRCGNHHHQTKKSGRRKRFLRKPTYVSKTQLKTLNKMLNGW